MRRRPDVPIATEAAILQFALDLAAEGDGWFYPYWAACQLQDTDVTPSFIGNGTMYRALRRMEAQHWFESRYEDAVLAEREHRPRRIFYRVTEEGAKARDRAPSVSTEFKLTANAGAVEKLAPNGKKVTKSRVRPSGALPQGV